MDSLDTGTSIQDATRSYERWLAEQTPLVERDLVRKHQDMAQDAFAFFRATYYRWAQIWPRLCSDLATAPLVLSVGDLHIENFGTWRDADGRLAWGINDFDEAYRLPYTNDLVRLATSVQLAVRENHLALRPKNACIALLDGYRAGLESGGRPFVLAEEHVWLLRLAARRERSAGAFWRQLSRSPEASDADGPSAQARAALESALPANTIEYRVHSRIAGEGSLGHRRWVAIADWLGGKIAREAKARAPSASVWCATQTEDVASADPVVDIVRRAMRSPDPALQVERGWLLRRLAHDCSRVELSSLPGPKLESSLLEAMGRETANVHLGTSDARTSILADLRVRSRGWLVDASRVMLKAALRDWKAFRRH